MSIKSRLTKINQVAQNTRQVFNNFTGRKIYRLDSTRTQKPYQIITDWTNSSEVKVRLYTFDQKEQVNDKGNHKVDFNRWTVCYQALGALKFAARQAGKVLSLCENKVNAERLLRFGGKLIKIVNLSSGIVWATIR